MASRIFKRTDLFQKFKTLAQKRYSSGHGHHHQSALEVDIAHRTTMDFLPKPKGSWEAMNAQRQKVNNLTLVAGIVIFVSSIVGPSFTGYWENMMFDAPYDKINKDFPGAKFVDAK